MRRATVLSALLFVSAFPVAAHAGSLDLRVGGFFPRTDSNLFVDDADLYQEADGDPLKRKSWNGWTGGVQFNQRIHDLVELGFSVDYYGRTLDTSYRDFVTSDGREIFQTLKLDIVPVGVQLRLGPTRRGQLSPYVAGGVDLFFWQYEEVGDFVDFEDPANTIIADDFISDGVTPGFHVAGGVRVPVSDDFSITAEGRYQWAKDDMGDDFAGNRIDLSGASATVGINLRF
jgi:opacity protein-like surface antigen